MGCCKADDESTLEAATPEQKEAAKAAVADNDKYEPSGAARIPGGAYDIGEVDIMTCEGQKDLERAVKEAAETSRGESGCCPCSGSKNLLKDFKYAETVDDAIKKLKEFDSTVADGEDLTPEKLLANYLGEKSDKAKHESPNPNFYEEGQVEQNLLHFNRKFLLAKIHDADKPPFKTPATEEKVEYIQPIPDERIDGDGTEDSGMSLKECQKELNRRGYNKPPYTLQVGGIKVSIQKEGSNPALLLAGNPDTTAAETADCLEAIVKACGENAKEEFVDGVPKVKKMTLIEARSMLKLISKDPRFDHGQPVVQPSYYERSCQNCYCLGLFWIYWVAMLVVAGIAISSGDPLALIRPIDYQSNTCGATKDAKTDGKDQIYFPQLAQDALAIYQDGDASCKDSDAGCFYGVCSKGCPKKGDVICNYETESAFEARAATGTSAADIVAMKKQYATLRKGCWFVQMQSIEIFYRCLPYEPEVETVEYECHTTMDGGTVVQKIETNNCGDGGGCTFTNNKLDPCTSTNCNQKCNDGCVTAKLKYGCTSGVVVRKKEAIAEYTEGTDDMSGLLTSFSSWLQQAGGDISNAWPLIVICGPALAGVWAFLFIFIMSFIAKLVVWATLLAVAFILIVSCCFFAWQAGYLTSLIEEVVTSDALQVNGTDGTTYAQQFGDGAQSATAFLETYAPFGDTNAEAQDTNQTIWIIAFYVDVVITVVYLLLLCVLRAKIRLAIELIKEAGRTLRKMKMLLFYPFFTYAIVVAMTAYFAGIAAYIITTTLDIDDVTAAITDVSALSANVTNLADLTTSAQAIASTYGTANSTDIVAYNATAAESNNFVRGLFIFHLFGYLWTVEYAKAIGMLTIAGAVASDYWITNELFRPSMPLLGSFYRALRYHAGSAVFGALVIAIIRLIRYIMMYIDSKTSELQKTQKWAKYVMIGIHCCLWCLEKCARYLTEAAYIMIAIEGRGFCLSAWRSFKLLFSNSLRIATTEVIAKLIIVIANLGITMGCTALTVLVCEQVEIFTTGERYVDNPLFPASLVFISALFVSFCFLQIYGMAITTLLLSFCLDEDKYKNGMYKKKLGDDGMPDGRMFCVINKKIGLIKLVSSNVREEQEAIAKERDAMTAETTALAMQNQP